MTKIISTNPANYQLNGEVTCSTAEEIKEKVAKAHAAKKMWKEIGVEKRIEYIRRIYDKFVAYKEELEELATKEMGMPKRDRNLLDADPGLDYFKWYLENVAASITPEVTFEDETTIHTVYYEPFGVTAVIFPWNFPITSFIWGVIPALLVGNPVVFKHSGKCVLTGKRIAELIAACDLPEGVFAEVFGGGEVGEMLVSGDIQAIHFTGSTEVGKHLYQIAAEKFIPATLELGGSAPGVVFEDADISEVVEMVWFNRFANSGQICDGLKRLIVHESRYDEVVDALKKDLENKKTGDPEDDDTDLGPLVDKQQLEVLIQQVEDAIEKGAKVVIGGKQPEGLDGAYYLPTLLTNVTKDMRAWKEEVFGPVLPIVTFKTEEEGVALANDSEYGLGSYVFTKDKDRAKRVALALEAGMVSTNVAWHLKPCNPFGGYKNSGIGREHGKYGFHELCQIKVVAAEK